MKTKSLIAIIVLAAGVIARAQTNDLSGALQKGLFEEEANHNLDAAIQAYQSLASQFDKDRKLAATAVFRLGECYRKLGKTNEAVVQYQRVVNEFSDQTTLATLSRQNLAGLGVGAQTVASGPTGGGATLDNLESQYALLKAQVEQARKETNLDVVATLFDDSRLKEELQNQQQKQAVMEIVRNSNPTPADLQKYEESFTNVVKAVQDARDALFHYQEIRLKILQSAIEQARTGQIAKAARGENESAAPTTDEEQQEIRRIQAMIQNSPDLINALNQDGLTPLHTAARQGQLVVARFLLDHGADVNSRSSVSQTPLIMAAQAGHLAMVDLLLSRGAAVDAEDSSRWTPLLVAAQHGFKSVIETLLNHKADINGLQGNRTPLFLATDKGQTAVVELLLDRGADPNATAVLDRAAQLGNLEIVSLLLAHNAKVNATNGTPLLSAIANKHADVAKLLLSKGADANTETDYGMTPLSLAAGWSLELVNLLLDGKADPNTGKQDRGIFAAILSKNPAILEALLQHGADPNKPGKARRDQGPQRGDAVVERTPLQDAVELNQPAMVKLLLQFKADPKLRTISSLYPLPLAVSKEERDIVELLLDNKADPNISGGNALFQALDSNPTSKTMAEIVQLLAGHGANLEVTNSIGQTPLLLGATQRKSEIAKILLEHGANPNARELEFGNSPLHWAVIHADTNLVFLLLAKKADVNEQNRFGVTPLELAKTGLTGQIQLKLYSNGGGYFDVDKPAMAEIARLLRDHGAIEDFPRLTRIAINRLFETPQTVFQKDTNNWNHFNLMEVIEHCSWGRIPAAVPGGAQLPPHGPAYPDFSRLIIHRLDRASTNSEKQIVVNLLNATNEFDCAKNTWLEFGDIVEIPERDHALSEQWIGLPGSQGSELANCVSRKVRLLVRGQTKEIMIYGSYLSDTLRDTEARSVLLSSSDLSRIKVKHHDPLTGKTMEFTIDETKASPPNDLWLRDGDVIEVPEK